MSLDEVYVIVNKCLKKEKEFKCYYDCIFKKESDDGDEFLFMIAKHENLSEKFRKILGYGSVQISYDKFKGGTLTIRSDFEFGKWYSKIAENVDFALNNLGFEFDYKIDDHENDYGYENGFQISRSNLDNKDLEREIDEMFVLFAFILDA